jgi:dTDP-4-dehydrorhamnose reductase
LKIVILGASGMAGHMIYYYLTSLQKYEIYTLCFRNKIEDASIILDVYNTTDLKKILKEINPDYVINGIGILIKGSQKSPENAIYINAYFPHLLVRLIAENNQKTKVIHISTDCVFSGEKGYYADTDIKDALDTYGMTKNLGEIIDDRHLTIRTSIIGPELKTHGEGLFHWIFTQQSAGQIAGYERSLWGGVTTLELAKAIEQCIDNNIIGLYQLTNNMKISKYELIQMIVTQFNLNITVQKINGIIVDKSIQSSQCDGFDYVVPAYNTMVEELYIFMSLHQNIYNQYPTTTNNIYI